MPLSTPVPGPRRRSPRVTAVLTGIGLLAWLTVASGRLSWLLAEHRLLPSFLLFATWPRGTMVWVRLAAVIPTLVLTVLVVLRLTPRWWLRAAAFVGGFLLVFPALSMPYPGARPVFEAWRPSMERAMELPAAADERYDYVGRPLPPSLAPLTRTGAVAWADDTFFFPQWTGIPDDAGGYLHTDGTSPVGYDMFGMECEDPTALRDDWWACNLPIEPEADWTWAWF